MRFLAAALREFLEKILSVPLSRSPSARVQPVVVGPPPEALVELFRLLTSEGAADWKVDTGAGDVRVVVLLVDGERAGPAVASSARPLSQSCRWDYAVALRNSVPVIVTLVVPGAWDARPESMANATETIGAPLRATGAGWINSDPWPFLVAKAALNLGTAPGLVRSAVRQFADGCSRLDGPSREVAPWLAIDSLLAPVPQGTSPANWLAGSVGFPSIGGAPLGAEVVHESSLTLGDLADLLAQKGMADGELDLLSTPTALGSDGAPSLVPHVQAMFAHLRSLGLSGPSFARCPAWFFRTGRDLNWWSCLTYDRLRRMLDELGASRPTGRLILECTNALNRTSRLDGEPFFVYSEVHLQASAHRVAPPSTVTFSRKQSRGATVALATVDGLTVTDQSPPAHDRPLVYQADAPGTRTGSTQVLVLDESACHGTARVRDAASNPPPSRQGTPPSYVQEIVLARGGTHDFAVYRDPSATSVTVEHEGTAYRSVTNPSSFALDLENGDSVAVMVLDASGSALGQWTVHVSVEEAGPDAPRTRFEALVRAHQEGRLRLKPVRPRDILARRMEDSYLSSSDSWRAVLACWTQGARPIFAIDWPSARAGDVGIQSDVRPPLEHAFPPASYLAAREAVRAALVAAHRTIGESILSDGPLAAAVENYVSEYGEWLKASPEAASWTDCIAVHAPTGNPQAGQVTATGEPLAILLSPLHPLRLGWHCAAQVMLEESLPRPCPAAGLLDSHACPDSMAIPIFRGGTPSMWRAFFAIGCGEPHWAILWNKDYLRPSPERTFVLAALSNIGLEPAGVTGGFTESQAIRALNDVRQILPARAVLRIGLTGSGEEASTCVDGLLEWFKGHFSNEDGASLGIAPFAVEVQDYRDNPTLPKAEDLAVLSEETGERVRWFAGAALPGAGQLDMTVMDQVGTFEPGGLTETPPSSARSPVGPGAAFRIRIREDLDNARFIKETRLGRQEREFDGLDGAVLNATLQLEALTSKDAGTTHLQFRPNQHAIGQRVDQSLFVALTSSQVDPACFIRGIRGRGAFLWDYELPGTMGFNEESAGYYLVARPPEALKQAVGSAVSVVTPSPPPVEELLEEISRRGIPVLKRLANGGNQSRGELGVLLAVRLLQDAFRTDHGSPRLPVASGDCMHLLLPVDSYWEPLAQLRRALDPESSQERPDLLVFCIRAREGSPVEIKITPLEVKFREGSEMSPGEIGAALRQAASVGGLLDKMWVQVPPSTLWAYCSTALLASCLDHAFRVYADPAVHGRDGDWTRLHERVIHDVVGQRAAITVCKSGRLLVFDKSTRTSVADMDGDGRLDSAILCPTDAEALLAGKGTVSPEGETAVGALDFSMPGCGACGQQAEAGQAADLEQLAATVLPGQAEAPTPGLPAEGLTEAGVVMPSMQAGAEQPAEEGIAMAVEEPAPASAVPPEVRQKVREAFDGFVGNESAVRRLTNDLLRALIERPPHLAKNYLLTGQPSTGKTELARRVANAVALPFIRLDGRGVARRERLFELVDGELGQRGMQPSQVATRSGLPVLDYPPLVVFIDEVHLVPRPVQEGLLTILEAADRTLTLQDRVAQMDHATFLFATTRSSDVDPAFRSRCTEIQLREYERTEVAEMLFRRHANWPREVLLELATLGRCVPRIAFELANELETEITVSEMPSRPLDQHLQEVARARDIDDRGLTPLDIAYLELLEREGRPLGEQAILNMLQSVDRDRILNEVEPFLVRRLRFATLGPRGREVTQQGREYLLVRRRAGR